MNGTKFKTLDNFTIKDVDRGIVTAHVTTVNVVDHDREVVVPGAIREGASVLMSSYGHAVPLHGEAPVGKGTIGFNGDAGIFRGQYFMNVPRARDAFEVVKQIGPDGAWSLGFLVERSSEPSAEWRARGAVRMLEKLDVFEVSPVGRGASVPRTSTLSAKAARPVADPAEIALDLKRFRRRELYAQCVAEPLGALAWNCAETCARWLSKGLLQEGPAVRWFDPDGRRVGFFDPLRPDEIHIARELKTERDVIGVVAHEAGHWWHLADAGEELARIEGKWLSRDYLDYLQHLQARGA